MYPMGALELEMKIGHQAVNMWAILEQLIHVISQIPNLVYQLYQDATDCNGDIHNL